ncbi:MAG: VCBS repeat-containing protein [Emticicia sp.]|nr:VCBS repeat-containing protein [Emticicia sp.]
MLQKQIVKILIFLQTIILLSCQNETPLFEELDAQSTNLNFENKLTESEKLNILSYEYFYNGGGLGAGDFNNDGLIDLYFSGNQVPNKLFLNKGELKFEDITTSAFNASIEASGAWKTGVSVADINNDGWLDIYVCHSGIGSSESRKNQLFINQGAMGGKWSGKFSEEAEKYGIADAGYSTQATFFDFDQDGDLDLFVLNHNLKNYERKEAAAMKSAVDSLAGDRLYQNNAGAFEDITLKAGIKSNPLGFGLGVVVSDFNNDNLPDLYVANDYVEEDYLYQNNGNGSFDEIGKESMGHFSYSAMGVDAADINNDGFTDIFTADMLPESNERQKLLAFPDNWNVQTSMLQNGFHWQNMRNMLQINQGNGFQKKKPVFAEIGQMAGVAATDWSWSPLFADFDNDGYKDLFVSNGFVRDLTDLDFVKYYLDQETKASQNQSSDALLAAVKKMPSTPTHHYIFKNNGDLTFTNQVKAWGFEKNKIASGAVYADLDNDGDLEIVTNNTNELARIYKNNQQEKTPSNYLNISLLNKNTFGIKVLVFAENKVQKLENFATHGFQSSMVDVLHFGLGNVKKVDSVKIIWASGKKQVLTNIPLNQTLKVEQKNLLENYEASQNQLFTETEVFNFTHKENDFLDFNRQILLPRLYSKVGPKITKGDVNNDGLEDIFITAPIGQNSSLYLQTPNGKFSLSKGFPQEQNKQTEQIDAAFVDIDNDNDLDIYVANGSYEQILEDKINEDALYLNDGKGRFLKVSNKIPVILTNKSCIKTLDFDKDNDQDIFIGGGVRAGLYPYSDPSYLLRNDGKGNFAIAQKFETGLLTDVALADINNDKFEDIVLVGEFMPIQVLTNQKGKFFNKIEPLLPDSEGWYSSIIANDLDNDGDIDFVIGNLGLNTPLRASTTKSIDLYFGDFDGNGSIDPFIGNYFGEKSFPIAGRDEASEQMVSLKRKFTDYKSFSNTSLSGLFEENTKFEKLKITNLKTGILWNEKGKFIWQDLPNEAQTAPVYAILIDDFNKDGVKDILLAGNNANFRIRIGKTDANLGLVLLGNKAKTFKVLPQRQTGLNLRGDIKSITKINKNYLFGVNNDKMKSFHQK